MALEEGKTVDQIKKLNTKLADARKELDDAKVRVD